MTKQEYMQKLQENLERFGQELQEDILEDYKQHFTEGEKQGKSEEEIIEELGNIEEMIRELAEEDGSGGSGRTQDEQSIFGKIKSMMPEVKIEISKNLEGLEKGFKDFGKNFEGFGKSFEGFGKSFEGFGKSFEGFGKSFVDYEKSTEDDEKNTEDDEKKTREYENSARGYTSEHRYTHSGECKAVSLCGEVADIHFEPSEDSLIHVEYENAGGAGRKYEFYQYEEDGIYYVGVKRKNNTEEDENKVKVKLFGQTVISYGKVSNYCGGVMLTVRVPDEFPKVEVKVTSGDACISGLHLNELQIQSVSGDISVSETTADHVDVNLTSGDIDIFGGSFQDGKFITASGDIDISKTEFGTVTFSTASGDISVDDTKIGSGRFGTGSGDVDIAEGYIESLICNTGSGDITVNSGVEVYECGTGSGDIVVEARKAPKRVSMNAGSGDIQLQMGEISGMNVTLETSMGDAQIRWKEEKRSEIKMGSFTYGDGSCKVYVKSGTGDISVSAG